jgi:ribosome biogenesis protein YTM1
MSSSPAQVKVIFTTTEQDLVLPESKQQLLVPAGSYSLPIQPQACV